MSPRAPSPRPGPDAAAASNRTKEENQERAFIAASRRKDRSLDARIESANRASSLHKQRTGRALHITREIVQDESMYEEIDDTYRTKLQQYMRAQNMQLSRDFDNSLLAGFTPSGGMPTLQMPSASQGQTPPHLTSASPSFSSSLNMPTLTQNLPAMHIRPRGSHSGPRGGHGPNHQRRASSVAPAGPIHAGRKMSLDFTQLRSGSISGPSTDLNATPGSFSPSYPTPGPIQAQAQPQSQSQAQAQMPAYVASTPTYAVRPQQQQQQQQQHHQLMQSFDGLFQGHAMSPSASFGGIPMHTPQFRNRIGSAPTIPVRAQAQALSLAQSHSRAGGQHSRNRSEPTPAAAEVPTPSSSSSSFSLGFFPHSSSNSDSTSTEMMTTPGSTSPHTPVSQASSNLRHNLSSLDLTDTANDAAKFDTDQQLQSFGLHLGLGAFPHQSADQDFVDFSDFAATLDQSHTMFPFNFQLPVDSGSLTADATFGDGPDMKEFITL